jgi:hypothetical protein
MAIMGDGLAAGCGEQENREGLDQIAAGLRRDGVPVF